MWHYYLVEMQQPSKHPIHLIERIFRMGPLGASEHVIQEYWNPTTWWRFEYLAQEMHVIRALPQPLDEEYSIDLYLSMLDSDLADRVFGPLTRGQQEVI